MNSEKKIYQVYAFQHPGSRGPFWKHLRFEHAIFFSRRFGPVRDWSLTRLLRELSVSIYTKNILWNPV